MRAFNVAFDYDTTNEKVYIYKNTSNDIGQEISKEGLSIGAIIGLTAGSTGLLTVILFGIYFFCKSRINKETIEHL